MALRNHQTSALELIIMRCPICFAISETKVRNLIYEIELKYAPTEEFDTALIQLIQQHRFKVAPDKTQIRFSVKFRY